MGDVFLRPMLDRLNSKRGPVSTIFSILPAITLATGRRFFFKKNFCFKTKMFRTDCNYIYKYIWMSKSDNGRCLSSSSWIFSELFLGKCLVLLSRDWYYWR